jgi:hypothetical protein
MTLSVPAGTYTPLIANYTSAAETITYRLVFTPSATATGKGAVTIVTTAPQAPGVARRAVKIGRGSASH